jgi:predicted Na+-dependent transporter
MITSIVSLVAPALLPALTDGLRGIFAKMTGGAGGNPQNVAERIQLMQAETERLKALAELDRPPGEPSRWVTDIRSLFRYAAITLIFLMTGVSIFSGELPNEIKYMLLDLSGACMSFVIGERMYLQIKK